MIKLMVTMLGFLISTQTDPGVEFHRILSGDDTREEKLIKLQAFFRNYSNTDSVGYLYHEAAKKMYRTDLSQAITWQQKATEKITAGQDRDFLTGVLFNLGLFRGMAGDSFGAVQAYSRLLQINSTDRRAGKAYSELSRISRKSGDYFQAQLYLEKSTAIFEEIGSNRNILLKNYLESVYLYTEMGTEDNRNRIFRQFGKIDSVSARAENSIPLNVAYTINSLKSFVYDDLGDQESAIPPSIKALEIASILRDSLRLASTYNNLGVSYLKTGNYQAAARTLRQVRKVTRDHKFVGASYNNLGDLHRRQADYDSALYWYRRSVEELSRKGWKDHSREELLTNPHKDDLITAYISRAKLFSSRYQDSREEEHLKACLEDILRADNILEIMREQSFEDRSRLYWRKIAHSVYSLGMDAAYQLNNIEKVFYFMEKNKAILLLADLNDTEVQRSVKLPPVIQETGRALKARAESEEDYSLEAYLAYNQFLDSVKQAYPEYARLKKKLPVISLQQLNDKIREDPQELIASYFSTGEYIYGLLLGSQTEKLFRFQIDSSFLRYLDLFNRNCRSPIKTEEDKKVFLASADALTARLFSNTFPDAERLTVIPDGLLSTVAFEALILRKTIQDEPKFLIQDYQVNYIYSLSYQQASNNRIRETGEGISGIAPVNFSYSDLPDLTYSLTEMENVKKILQAEVITGPLANMNNAIHRMASSAVVHFSTHAGTDRNGKGWIALTDGLLNTDSIYQAENNTELIILSACETATGARQAGEGVMSLARSFFYGGTRTVISTLWKVDDLAASVQLTELYRQMDTGKTAAEALTITKRKYIDQAVGSEWSPYYWSAFVLLGDADQKLPRARADYPVSYLLILLSVFGIILFFVLRTGRNSRPVS